MRFWDSSAIVPLLVNEPATAAMHGLLERDESIAVWWATPTECFSAIERLCRSGILDAAQQSDATANLDLLTGVWNEIYAAEEVRKQARRLLRVHPLRAADALQLSAAIVWSGRVDGREFVSLDDRLRTAGRAEGFAVLP